MCIVEVIEKKNKSGQVTRVKELCPEVRREIEGQLDKTILDKMFRIAQRWTGNDNDAADAVAQVCLEMCQKPGKWLHLADKCKGGLNLLNLSICYRAVQRRAIDIFRRKHRTRTVDGALVSIYDVEWDALSTSDENDSYSFVASSCDLEAEEAFKNIIEWVAIEQKIEQAIQQLNEENKRRWKIYMDCTSAGITQQEIVDAQEIADAMGITLGAYKTWLCRQRRWLMELLLGWAAEE